MSQTATSDKPRPPGVIAPPPLIFAGFLVLGYLVELVWSTSFVSGGFRLFAGAVLFFMGAAIAFWAISHFRTAGTSLDVRKPDTALVTTGPYRYSRNPMYLGLTFAHVGVAIWADSLWMVAMLVPAQMVMHIGVIAREERHLEAQFGHAYRDLKARVRRWL
jgi:protein-S-isoprenylcysteine O-methyltransferase Ste14